MIRRLTRMVIETGTLTGQHEITLVIFSRLNLITTWTAVFAVINLVMFQIPGVSYYQAVSEVLGKMYSNTMMMNLNSRMVSWFGVTNDTVLNEPSTDLRFVLSTSNGGISVTREEWIFTWRLKASLCYKSGYHIVIYSRVSSTYSSTVARLQVTTFIAFKLLRWRDFPKEQLGRIDSSVDERRQKWAWWPQREAPVCQDPDSE